MHEIKIKTTPPQPDPRTLQHLPGRICCCTRPITSETKDLVTNKTLPFTWTEIKDTLCTLDKTCVNTLGKWKN